MGRIGHSRTRRWLVVVLATGLLATAVPVASADPGEVRQAEEQLEQARRAASEAERQLADIARRFELAVEDYAEARVHLDGIRLEMAGVLQELQSVETAMHEREGQAGDLARRLYQHGTTFELVALLGARTAFEMPTRVAYVRSATQAQYAVVDELRGDRRHHASQLSRLEEFRAEAAQAEQELERQRRTVEALLISQRDEVARLEADVAAAQEVHVTAVVAEATRLEQERLERERLEREARERAAREAAARAAARRAATTQPRPRADAPAGEAARIAVDEALAQLGKPYRWGAGGPDAYDCSGLTSWAWEAAGVDLPRSSRAQYAATAEVAYDDMQLGDLLFFGTPIHHVAMYIGNGDVVEAPFTGSEVRINSSAIHRDDLVGIGRPS